MVRQRRWAARRHASIHSGSVFLAEMNRTMSSDRPFGALSDSISVTNPYLYWSTSMRRTRSIVSWTAGIHSSAHGSRPWQWTQDLGCRLWSVSVPGRAPPPQAAISLWFPALYRLSASFSQAFRMLPTSPSEVEYPRLTRIAPRESSGGTPIAARTCEGATFPEEQAAPDDTATPSRSK